MNAPAPRRWLPASAHGRAALLMLASTASFALMAIAIRLASQTIPTTEVVFFRNFFGLLALLPMILRPGSSFTAGMLVALLGSLLSALVSIQIKQLSKLDAPDTIVFWTYVLWVPMSLVPALFVWHAPQGIAWLWLALCGVLGTIGQLLWTRALQLGEVSALQPISFVQLPIVVLFGWWLFGETVDGWTMAGAAIVLGANGYIAHREAMLLRRAATTAPVEAAKPGE